MAWQQFHHNIQTALAKNQGQSLVELLLAIGLAAIILPVLVGSFTTSREGRAQHDNRVEALALMQETQEAVRNIREAGWSNIDKTGTFHPAISGTTWSLESGDEPMSGGFTRSIFIEEVYRDSNGNIVDAAAGTKDPSTKKVTITISWTKPMASSIQSVGYLSRYLDNLTWDETTEVEFKDGTLTGTATRNDYGGEVTLGAGSADWCKPELYDDVFIYLPKLSNAIVAKEGHAWLGSGDGTGGPAFINVGIDTPPPPAKPIPSVVGTYNGTFTTNAIHSDGNYVYLATTDTTKQIKILDISSTPYSLVGTVTLPGGKPANGVYVVGNLLYATSQNKLYTFDITNRAKDNTTVKGSASLWFSDSSAIAKQVVVVNNYAFVGAANTFFGLQKFKVSNGGATLSAVWSLMNFFQTPQGLYVNATGTRAYLAFNQGGIFPRGFYIIDTSGKDGFFGFPFFQDSLVGKYSTGNMDPRGIKVVSGNRAIVVGVGGEEYQVLELDPSEKNDPKRCGGLDVEGGVFGIDAILDSYDNAYSYIITGKAGEQFKIIQGGNGGSYAKDGTYESSIFTLGYQTSVNYFTATIAQPASTEIKMQVAGANPADNNCNTATYTFVGPDKDPAAFFTPTGSIIEGTVPFGAAGGYNNPARCFKYKVFFSTDDPNQTPVLYDTRFNYSP